MVPKLSDEDGNIAKRYLLKHARAWRVVDSCFNENSPLQMQGAVVSSIFVKITLWFLQHHLQELYPLLQVLLLQQVLLLRQQIL